MSIKELPKATSRLLSSSQVLTTPASLVKELLDNALDAKATSIDIIVAVNTLDKIEVRDDGYGIPPADLSAIGKRGYTSKLRHFDELKALGGLSLGFRGEALASAIALGDVSITTRVEGEAMATAIKLNAHGGIESQTSVAHPVGTTVCVSNFFSRLPVRKQTALKDTKKTMSTIKEMLQSYALARLNVRLTFRVLKAGKGKWSFAPRANEGMRDIVSQVIGRNIVSQCMEMISTLPIPPQIDTKVSSFSDDASAPVTDGKSSESLPQSGFIMQALLPKLDADLTKISGGQYVSIDSRPVSPARGSLKKIIAIYKSIISAMLVDNKSEKVKSPFIRLNIVCPAGSYDPNIEPSKDDVLFENEGLLLSLVEDWFRSVYGDRITTMNASNRMSTNRNEFYGMARDTLIVEDLIVDGDASPYVNSGSEFSKPLGTYNEDACVVNDPVLEVSPKGSITGRNGAPTSSKTPNRLPAVHQSRIDFDMSEDYPDEMEIDDGIQEAACDELIARDPREKQISHNFNSLDPWVIAKLNAPVIKKKTQESTLPDPARRSTGKRPPSMLPTPSESSVSLPSSDYRDLRSLGKLSYESIAASDNLQSPLWGWLKQNCELSHNSSTRAHDTPLPSTKNLDGTRALAVMGSVVMHRDMPSVIPLSPPATQAHLSLRVPRDIKRPLVSPLRNAQSAFPLVTELRVKNLPLRRPQHDIGTPDMVFDREAHGRIPRDEKRLEVQEALEFERRKEAATRKLREELRRSLSSAKMLSKNDTTRSSLHKNRYCAAIAALESNPIDFTSERVEDKMPAETCLPDDDPLAYLMRRQKSIVACSAQPSAGHKIKRAKTMLLPLETVPDRAELHSLCQVVSTNISHICKVLLTLASHDQYTKSGNQARGLAMSPTDVQAVERKLRNLVKDWRQVMTGEQIDVVLDLGVMQGRSVADA